MNGKTLEAEVQYGDYDGSIAGDRHDRETLESVAAKYGIDTKRYFVFGADVFIGENDHKLARANVTILAIDKSIVGVDNIDGIQKYIDNNSGILPYSEFDAEMSVDEFIFLFKRFNFVIKNRYIRRVNEYRRVG
ncbi:MAG: hypothetical protein JNM55_09285 [Anaerolineales bacterium]|nr:hypothetical protein [Anaerolineales bacterium]